MAVVLGLTMALPIWVMTPFDFDKFGEIKSEVTLMLAFLAAAVLISAVFLGRVANRLPRVPLVLLVLLIVHTLMSALLSVEPEVGLNGNEVRFDGFSMVAANSMFFAGAAFLGMSDSSGVLRRAILGVMCAASVPVVVYAWMQAADLDPITWEPFRQAFMRPFASLGNPIFLGAYSAVVAGVCLAFGCLRKGRARRPCWVIGGANAGIVVLSATRASWIALGVGLLVLAVISFRRGNGLHMVLGVVIAAVLAVGVVVGAHAVSRSNRSAEQIGFAAGSLVTLQGERNAGRLAIWGISLDIIRDHPVLGVGPDEMYLVFEDYRTQAYDDAEGADRLADKPHSSVLEYAVETGIPGVLLFVALVGVVLVGAFRVEWGGSGGSSSAGLAILVGAIVYFTQSLVTVSAIGLDALWWTLLGFAAASRPRPVSPVYPETLYHP